MDVLGDISPANFLQHYWQQKPLLIKGGFSEWNNPLSADELAGLACEDGIESRVISGTRATNEWDLFHGPFTGQVFTKLGEQDWTLLVQATDHLIDAIDALKQPFRFLPDWRIDDVMTSFAAPGGSVGPHFDQYDVFLIQGQGQRRWRLGQMCDDTTELLPHDSLKILKHFQQTEEYLVEPGDILYVPPGLAHWGVAETPSMTYSVGFRAPSHAELLANFCDEVISHLNDSKRYNDAGRTLQSNPGKITQQSVSDIKHIIHKLVNNDDLLIASFGRYMTEPKYGSQSDLDDEQVEQIIDVVKQGFTLAISPEVRLAYFSNRNQTELFINGSSISKTGSAWHQFVEALCAKRIIAEPDLNDASLLEGLTELLTLNCAYLPEE